MEITLNSAVQMIAVAVFICGVINYTVIKPFNESILRLSNSVSRLEKVIEGLEGRQHEFEKQLAILEQSAKSAHHRIDELKEEISR